MQIVRKHWRKFLPGTSRLDHDQKREFLLGWLNWFVAETIAVGAALLNLIWVPFIALDMVAVPDVLLTFPIIAAFLGDAGPFCLRLPDARRGFILADAGRDDRVHVGAMDGRQCGL